MQSEHIVLVIRQVIFLLWRVLFIFGFLWFLLFLFLIWLFWSFVLLSGPITLLWFLGHICCIGGRLQLIFKLNATCFSNFTSLLIGLLTISQRDLFWLELRLFAFVECFEELLILLNSLLFSLLLFHLCSFFRQDLSGWCSCKVV